MPLADAVTQIDVSPASPPPGTSRKKTASPSGKQPDHYRRALSRSLNVGGKRAAGRDRPSGPPSSDRTDKAQQNAGAEQPPAASSKTRTDSPRTDGRPDVEPQARGQRERAAQSEGLRDAGAQEAESGKPRGFEQDVVQVSVELPPETGQVAFIVSTDSQELQPPASIQLLFSTGGPADASASVAVPLGSGGEPDASASGSVPLGLGLRLANQSAGASDSQQLQPPAGLFPPPNADAPGSAVPSTIDAGATGDGRNPSDGQPAGTNPQLLSEGQLTASFATGSPAVSGTGGPLPPASAARQDEVLLQGDAGQAASNGNVDENRGSGEQQSAESRQRHGGQPSLLPADDSLAAVPRNGGAGFAAFSGQPSRSQQGGIAAAEDESRPVSRTTTGTTRSGSSPTGSSSPQTADLPQSDSSTADFDGGHGAGQSAHRGVNNVTERGGPVPRPSAQLDAGSPRFADRLAQTIQNAQHNGRPLRVRLHPPELGMLQISVSARDGVISAQLDVQTSAAHQTILENISLLRDALVHHGAPLDRIDVQLAEPVPEESHAEAGNGNPQQGEPHSDGQQRHGRSGDGDADEPADPDAPVGSLVDELDIQI